MGVREAGIRSNIKGPTAALVWKHLTGTILLFWFTSASEGHKTTIPKRQHWSRSHMRGLSESLQRTSADLWLNKQRKGRLFPAGWESFRTKHMQWVSLNSHHLELTGVRFRTFPVSLTGITLAWPKECMWWWMMSQHHPWLQGEQNKGAWGTAVPSAAFYMFPPLPHIKSLKKAPSSSRIRDFTAQLTYTTCMYNKNTVPSQQNIPVALCHTLHGFPCPAQPFIHSHYTP